MIRQTGVLNIPPSPGDYISGGSTAVVYEDRVSNWEDYLPTKEKQYNYSFDTMSCTTFSALNVIEMQMRWLVEQKKLTEKQLELLEDYFDTDGNFNCSDRFTAIMSSTSREGNTFRNVWESIRKDGLLPEKDLPFGDSKTWDEYHNWTAITPKMREKARKILKVLKFQYEWVFYDEELRLSEYQYKEARKAVKQAPLHISIPVPGTHALTLYKVSNSNYMFDQYEPFRVKKRKNTPIHYAMKGYVSVLPEEQFMKKIIINRTKTTSKETLGELIASNAGAQFSCKTLELPNLNNQKNISCIPSGTYTAKYTFSPKFMKFTYEIQNVPNRSGIRIHSANYYNDLSGCVALGSGLIDLNKDGELDITNSRATIKLFEEFMQHQDFSLTIT